MPSLASRASTSPAIGRVLHAYEICCDKRPEHSLGRATPTSLQGDGFPPFCAFRPQRAASHRQPAAAEDESRSRTSSQWCLHDEPADTRPTVSGRELLSTEMAGDESHERPVAPAFSTTAPPGALWTPW